MSWTIALGQLLERRKQTFNYMFAAFMFSGGAFQFFALIGMSDKVIEYPYFAFLHLPFLVLIGPEFYFCFKSVIGSNYHLKWPDLFHLLPASLITIMLIPLCKLNPDMKRTILLNPPSFLYDDPMRLYYSAIVTIVMLIVMSYLVYYLKEFHSMFTIRFIREKKISIAFVISVSMIYAFGFIFIICIIAANFFVYSDVLYTGIVRSLLAFSSFGTMLILAMSRRDGNYFMVLRSQSEKSRYEKSKIKNLDIELVLSRIRSLMEDEKVFCDEDLSLNSLAGELEIGANQLSQIINENFNKNFNAYINEYRIEEAKKILLDDRERTIVSISYAVGFNSPARFYEWFYKMTEATPSRFRKKALC
jgi:AraC-like DNA-binding protein